MKQVRPIWEENEEFAEFLARVVAEHPRRYAHINPDAIIAYCRVDESARSEVGGYSMTGETAPEQYINSKQYFVKMAQKDWAANTEKEKLQLVRSVLARIPEDGSGRILPRGAVD